MDRPPPKIPTASVNYHRNLLHTNSYLETVCPEKEEYVHGMGKCMPKREVFPRGTNDEADRDICCSDEEGVVYGGLDRNCMWIHEISWFLNC